MDRVRQPMEVSVAVREDHKDRVRVVHDDVPDACAELVVLGGQVVDVPVAVAVDPLDALDGIARVIRCLHQRHPVFLVDADGVPKRAREQEYRRRGDLRRILRRD